uniref:Myosin motor domain-containing protein n=1 Tax=Loa loa TaxID=7209 RepID=A0A1I7W4X4_LOALO
MINDFGTLGQGKPFAIENYKKGTHIWLRDPEKVWIGGELLHDFKSTSRNKIRLQDGQVTELVLRESEELPFLRNPDVLLGCDDLTTLSYLHEPAVLNHLSFRFVRREAIYTYCGIVLVAINPYANCSQLYGDDVIQVYRGVGKQVRELDPHIYAVAEEAFFDLSKFGKDQSVIVSGESGAGKTVSAKYLASVACSSSNKSYNNKPTASIEDRVLASNPIMEAIGNAKTIRNDNSSRFGKYIQIDFNDRLGIAGAEMRTYLLEKSRVVFQAENERNYHIFYQICASRSHAFLEGFELDDWRSYFYTTQGNSGEIEAVDDRNDFLQTLTALDLLRIPIDVQKSLLRFFVGLLLFGNIRFIDGPDEYAKIDRNSSNVIDQLCEKIYEVKEDNIRLWLTAREIVAGGESVRKPLTTIEAVERRDALAKILYAAAFAWIVKKVNEALGEEIIRCRSRNSERFIGVLDIYGFETLEVNSFEQFCINYANEKLQQQFCQHVFKLEQSEYEREEIDWIRIDFYDNQPCIDLIEGRPGIIDYLDEQCKMGQGTDRDWLEKLRTCQSLKKTQHFQLPKIKNPTFIIRHFADDVTYNVDGFLAKNKDTVSEQLMIVMKKSKFRDSLRELMAVLSTTRPHYVRCIKPNDEKLPFTFKPKRAIQQLRACGILETVRISATGYPSRWMYEDFARRYRILYPEKRLWFEEPKIFAEKACNKYLENKMYALGKTKVFFRTGQVALLERILHEKLTNSAIMIQKIWKGYISRKKYQHIKESLLKIQLYSRAFLVYRRMKYLQMHRAAICIQTAFRCYAAQRRYRSLKGVVIMIQTHYRASLIRQRMEKLRYEQKTIIIQKYWRGWLVRRHQIERNKKIVMIQCQVRQWLARRRLRELKIEARSVGHLQKLNRGLENKIISLQQKLDFMTAENGRLWTISAEADKMRAEMANLETQRCVLLATKAHAEELEAKVKLLEASRKEEAAKNTKLEEELQNTKDGLKMECEETIAKLNALNTELSSLRIRYNTLMKQKKLVDAELIKEKNHRLVSEQEISQMREQLLANANLLASPAVSRVGSIRLIQKSLNQSILVGGTNGKIVTVGLDGNDLDEVVLILKQQHAINVLRSKIEQISRENDRLKSIMDANMLIENLDKRTTMRAFEAQRMQELELSYTKLKDEMERLLEEKMRNGSEAMNFRSFVEKILEENDRRREEAIELRAILMARFEQRAQASNSSRPDSDQWSGMQSDDGSCSDLDEELSLGRQCRQLKSHMQMLSQIITKRDAEIERLENRLNEFTASKRSTDDSHPIKETLSDIQQQLNQLASENLSLQDKINQQSDELSEAKAQLRGCSGRITFSLDNTSDADIIRLEALKKESVDHSSLLEVFNVPEFTRILVCDLKPRLARLLTPCLPAYLLLAAFRYYDHIKDEAGLTGLFSAIHIVLKDTLAHSNDMDVLSLWLVNSWRLLNLLRQYSGENNNEWSMTNSEKQNNQRMQSFDLSPLRNQLRARVEESYQNLLKRAIEPVLSPKIVPAILQHESSQKMVNGSNVENNQRRQSMREQSSQRALDDLIELLNFIQNKLKVYGADSVLLGQVFGQMTYWICALALNHLMFRKELCNFEKAIQIKHNVTEVQSWLSSNGLSIHRETLEPLVQASHLLQSKKDESNLDTLCGEMTSKLKPKQASWT